MDIMAKKNALFASIDVSTRRKRKAVTHLIIDILIKIRFAEQEYLGRIPLHLRGSTDHTATEETIDTLIAATVALSEAF